MQVQQCSLAVSCHTDRLTTDYERIDAGSHSTRHVALKQSTPMPISPWWSIRFGDPPLGVIFPHLIHSRFLRPPLSRKKATLYFRSLPLNVLLFSLSRPTGKKPQQRTAESRSWRTKSVKNSYQSCRFHHQMEAVAEDIDVLELLFQADEALDLLSNTLVLRPLRLKLPPSKSDHQWVTSYMESSRKSNTQTSPTRVRSLLVLSGGGIW